MDTYLTAKQVAEFLHTTASSLRYMRSQGRGPEAVLVGRRLLYSVADVERWIEGAA